MLPLKKIILSSAHLQQLEKMAKDSLPNESCAFLLGDGGESEVTVKEVMPMENADASRVSFTITPDETLRAYQIAEGKNLQVAGIFHSHPSPPLPSRTDARFMEVNPVVWVIYSTTAGRFGAWIFDGGIKEVKMATNTTA